MALKRQRTGGLTLIEILIALAVFLIGILAVLRIFPQGLGTLVRSSDRSEALLVAEARLTELQSAADRLPDYILPAGRPTDVTPGAGTPNPAFGFLRALAGTEASRPYDLGRPFGILANPTEPGIDPVETNLLHRLMGNHRLVVGERVQVGRRSVAPAGGGALQVAAQPYLALFGPLGDGPTAGVADLTVFRTFRQVRPLELRRTVAGAAGSQVYQDRPVFAVVDGGRDPFTDTPLPDVLLFELDGQERQFSIGCHYRDAYGTIRYAQLAPFSVVDPTRDAQVPGQPVPAPVPYAEVDLRLPDAAETAITEVVPESVTVRQVIGRGVVDAAPANRFHYDDAAADHGLLTFSPLLTGETLSLEYVAEDWRILRERVTIEDLTGPDGTGGPDGLIDDCDDDPANGTGLQLAARQLDEDFAPRAVLLATGQPLAIDQATWTANPDQAVGGVVPINPAITPALAGPQEVLVYYRRRGNWQVAPAVAPTRYVLASDAPSIGAGFAVLSLLVDSAPFSGDNTYTELRFRPSEAGRVVAVTYEVGAPGARRLVVGELHVVPAQANRRPGTPDTWQHAIVLQEPNVAVDGNTPPRLLIHNIEGRSLQVRVGYDEDSAGREVDAGSGTISAEALVEVSTYVRRDR